MSKVRPGATCLIAALLTAGLLLSASEASPAAPSQAGRNFEKPPGWMVRFDDGEGAREHVVMRPGWHIHPGGGALDIAKFAIPGA